MKRFTTFLIAMSFSALFFSNADAQTRNVDWDVFGKNLVKAIHEGNPGLQQSAMCMIIRYGDSLDVKDAVYDVMSIFRTHKECNVRLLAMVTLRKLEVDWAMYYLKRNIEFEKDEIIRKHNCCIVDDYYAKKEAPGKEETDHIISLR